MKQRQSFMRLCQMALLISVLVISSVACAAQQTARFFESLPDIPLMTGLKEASDQASLFDKPEGRIADVIASGEGVSKAQVESYYRQSLPQFGWKAKSGKELLFRREGEELRLNVTENQGYTNLHILISPQ